MNVDRQPNELVGEHPAAPQSRVAVVVIADSDAGARPEVVVGLEVEQADGARVGVALEVSPHPVIAIAEPVRKQAALRVEQQPRRSRWPKPPPPRRRLVARADDRARRNRRLRWRVPRPSTRISLTVQPMRSSQLPVFNAIGITVFCVPHFASTSQANPTHQRQRMQPARPL